VAHAGLKVMSEMYSFLKCGIVENTVSTQPGFRSPLHDSFFTLLHLTLGFDPYFGKHRAGSTNQPLCQAAATSIS